MKQLVEEFVAEVPFKTERKLQKLIEDLQNILSEHQYKYKNDLTVSVYEETEDYRNYYYLEIRGMRCETDSEYKNRLLREKAKELQRKQEEDLARAKKFKLYQELRKEFEQ